MTGQDLIDAASDLADMANDPHVSAATWLRWANRGQEKLWRKLVPLYQGFYSTWTNFTLSGGGAGQNTTSIGTAARIILGVTKDPDSVSQRTTLRRYNFDERDDQPVRSFAVVGQTIEVRPFEWAPGTYRMYYVKGPTLFTAAGDSLDVQLEPFAEYLETYMAYKALAKEESPTDDLAEELKTLWEEIEGIAMSRNSAASETISDVERTGGSYGWP